MLGTVLREGSRNWLAGIQGHAPSPYSVPSALRTLSFPRGLSTSHRPHWRPAYAAVLWSLLCQCRISGRGTGSTKLCFGAHCWSINVATVWDCSQCRDMAVGQPLQLCVRMVLRKTNFGRADTLKCTITSRNTVLTSFSFSALYSGRFDITTLHICIYR